MANQPKSRLGRGLGGLITGSVVNPPRAAEAAQHAPAPAPKEKEHPVAVRTGEGFEHIPTHLIDTSPFQARREIDPTSLAELCESIRSVGLLQPVLVRRKGERYELLAGERRWRASMQLQMKKIPARVTQAGDPESAVIGLIENLQREDLNPVEEAGGYASLIRDFDLTQEAVAERVGRSRPAIANALRLLQLETEIQGYLSKNLLTVGHAKVLLGVEPGEERLLLARKVLEKGLSVRDLEQLVAGLKNQKGTRNANTRPTPQLEEAAVQAVEKQIASRLSTKVMLRHTPKRGRIIIEYYGNEDLQRILEKMGAAQ